MSAAVGKVVWAGRVLSALVVIALAMSGVMKLKGGPDTEKGLEHLGLPLSMIVPLAILELSCVAVYAIPLTSILGALLLTGYLGGAILTHWRVGDPFIAQIILGMVIWLGVYLRDDRLKALLPIRRPRSA